MTALPPFVAVVDDDPSMGQAIRRLLAAGGFRTRVFDCAEALEASGCVRMADCLVLDMRLPGVGGAEYYATLARPRPPVIFITAHDDDAARRSAERAGAHACLAKPFDGPAFLEMVNNAARSGSWDEPRKRDRP